MCFRVFIRLLLLSASLLLQVGCTTVEFVELREIPANPITEKLTKTAFGSAAPSARTQSFLSITGYSSGDDYVRMLRHCRLHVRSAHHREALNASAEISYLAACSARDDDPGLAMELYLDAARDAWSVITLPGDDGNLQDPNGRGVRDTVEFYNTSLREMLRLVKHSGDYRFGNSIRMPVSGRLVSVDIPFPTEWLTKQQLGEFAFVSDYELTNLRNRHTTDGVGVPIMVRRARPTTMPDGSRSLEKYYAKDLTLPVTVVARFGPKQSQPGAPDVELQLFDPRESDGVLVGETLLPMQSDISTPLAWFLTDPRNSLLETFAFFWPDKAKPLEGLYMVQPYDPDRIPVLMVHGIWSSPITWMEMFNDLQADPVLREKYQFWFYMYPTGEPLTFAVAKLRDRLKEVRQSCDPHGQNPKLDQTVMVGHSMGGLMAYLMTVDSENKLWNALSQIPVEKIQADPATKSQIQRVFFFESDESIDRIVTIASPFRGSGYSNFFTQWLSGSLVSLPNTTSRLSQLIFKQNHQSVWDRMFAPRTSVDSLNRNSAVLQLVAQTALPDEVEHHNVIGISKGKTRRDWSDGVVKVESAAREDVDSEIHVKASHSKIHRHPTTIAEVRRVLLEHLEDVRKRRYPIVPLNHSRQAKTSSPASTSRM